MDEDETKKDNDLLEELETSGLITDSKKPPSTMDQVNEVLKDDRSELIQNTAAVSSNCFLLQQRLTEMSDLHARLNKQMRRRDSVVYNAAFTTYEYVSGLFGNRSYTLQELFDLQLENIGCISGELEGIIKYSRDELAFIESYRTDVSKKVTQEIGVRKKDKLTVEDRLGEYKQLRGVIDDKNVGDEDYFTIKNALVNLKNQIKESSHGYILSSDAVDDDGREFKFLVLFEDLLRESIHITERYNKQVQRRENHLTKTKRSYQALSTMQETVGMLFDTMETITGYTMYVHTLIGDGMKEMMHTLNSPNMSNRFYDSTSSRMGGVLDYIDGVKKTSIADVERRLDEMK